MTAVPGFLPSTNGLHFANRFPAGPTAMFGPIDPRWFGIGDASSGLCGGMAWYVREWFDSGLPIPMDAEPPVNGSPLFQALVRRQVQSLDWLRTPLRFWWVAAFGPERTIRRTREQECPHIRTTVDAGHLAMVGLIRHQGINPFRLTESHQVLAFSAESAGDSGTFGIYDPNWPGRDDVTIVADANGVRQSTGETLYGFFEL
ncbi:MAG: hypothetical protein QOJ75_280 [Chloroflexota bacterium]|jgi:hypothetical protein|nr:hypothetical protein [Chloroflexota bacterium]